MHAQKLRDGNADLCIVSYFHSTCVQTLNNHVREKVGPGCDSGNCCRIFWVPLAKAGNYTAKHVG